MNVKLALVVPQTLRGLIKMPWRCLYAIFYCIASSSDLQHHGILGMKWGIRRYQNQDGTLTAAGKKRYSSMESIKTKSGETLTLAKTKGYKAFPDDTDFDIYARGEKAGHLFLEKHGDELYINWIDIKKQARGRGYASSVMDYVVNYGEKNGYKYASLEVPSSSPDARHIYEKHGFKEIGKVSSDDDIWGGLTAMRREFNRKK